MPAEHATTMQSEPARRPDEEQTSNSAPTKTLSARFASKVKKSLVPKFLRKVKDTQCEVPSTSIPATATAPSMSEEELVQNLRNSESLALRKKAMDWMLLASQSCDTGVDTFMKAAMMYDLIYNALGDEEHSNYVLAGASLSIVSQALSPADAEERIFRTPTIEPQEVMDVINVTHKLIDVDVELAKETPFDHLQSMTFAAGVKKASSEFMVFGRYTCELYAVAMPLTDVDPMMLAAAAVSYNMSKMRMKTNKKFIKSLGNGYEQIYLNLAREANTLKSKPLHNKYSKILKTLKKNRRNGSDACSENEGALLWGMAGLVAFLDLLFAM
mmetsp:Transcript_13548/g.21164  ORF Transcript_13548/g.21164 Transcript_13548/m.21164 type:complete len:328 (+) Transcript_13548:127-1110(+)|eukprot:CAMPEP_0184307504 /NCGR_PEP_ID=MMETSP1049-20130417/16240_1 /TAXON_ID=77928 /ORGANISM="Proteomonas sulcata, Strain CCMP704" /LENGTH=327 /DNA_ID=CAMNT_0026620017 /DNA_START=53 /DNA_END=1036 /DNA_ORIENTATION=+